MPAASGCVRRACVESVRSKMWGSVGRIPAIGPIDPTWGLLLTEDLREWMTPALRLTTMLVALRHLMLLGPRIAGGWMSWPNDDCSLDSTSPSIDWASLPTQCHQEACQCKSFLSRVSSALNLGHAMPRGALRARNCYRVGFCHARWSICPALSLSSPSRCKVVVDGGPETGWQGCCSTQHWPCHFL